MSAHRVVIVGTGFGGLFAAKALRGAGTQVTLLGRVNHHLFQPLLYQVATGILSEGEVAPSTRDIFRHRRDVRVELADVTGFDLAQRLVFSKQLDRTLTTPYDTLIVAAGLETSYFGHDEFSNVAPGLKSIDDALELRGRIFEAFEIAETEQDPQTQRRLLTFVVVGGGPSGVEMAGQIIELSRHALRSNFRTIDPSSAHVMLVEGAPRILGAFGERVSKIARRDLTCMGVDVRTGWKVVGMDEGGVELESADGSREHVEAATKVWAAGVVASPLARMLAEATGAELDRTGRIGVLDDCTLPGHPEVFAIGDMMALHELPGLAEVAIQTGIHAAMTVRRRLRGDTAPRPFRYHDLGSMAAIARFRAVANIHGVTFGGFVGWALWIFVHLTFLTGFKNRLSAVAKWTIAFVGSGRSERVITRQQIEARRVLAERRRRAAQG